MRRVAKAAQQLLSQVDEQVTRVSSCVVGDPDGYGVYRSVQVDAVAIRGPLADDPRVRAIAVLDSAAGPVAIVTFVAGTAADRTEPFDLG